MVGASDGLHLNINSDFSNNPWNVNVLVMLCIADFCTETRISNCKKKSSCDLKG